MNKILIAVDDSKGAETAVKKFNDLFMNCLPESIVLLYIQKIEGRSLMDEMLGEAEMSTLKEMLEGTEYKEMLDRKADRIISYYRDMLEKTGAAGIKTVIKEGHPAEAIIDTAKEEGSEMIIIGSRGSRMHTWMMGSVSREVANRSDISVLIAR